MSDEALMECVARPENWFVSQYRRLKSRIEAFFDDGTSGNLYWHAKRELEAAGYFKKDPDDKSVGEMNGMMAEDVLKLIATFSKQGHSGFSAGMCVSIFTQLARFQPLIPLQGTDDEWNEVTEYYGADNAKFRTWQNNRCSHVFKDESIGAYDIDAVVYREPDGCTYTKGGARHLITFPYVPTVTYVDVPFPEDHPKYVPPSQADLPLGT